GNTDFCKTTIIIQDVNDICPNTSNFGKITGDIKTLKAESTKLVNMQLLKNNIVVKEAKASPYYFLDLGMSTEYVVQPSRNDNHLNGVTTGDIVKIQKHILGQQLITNPYLLIAADVNNNGSITAADISIIRKLILGIIPEFKSVPSWTFIPKNYVFVNPDEPWLAPRNASVMLNEKIKVVDFVSIKMGDINETATSGLGSVVETRNSEKPLNFNVKDVELVAGETYRINFNASDFTDIMGYQFTLEFDQEAILYQGFEAAALPLTEANFGLNKVGEGIITTSWNSNSAMSVEAHDKLFYLIFKANKNTSLSKVLKLGDGITRAEAYHSDLTPFEVKLNVTNESNQNAEFALYQNEPNPFKKEAVISFNLPKAMPSSLTIYDQNGKVVRIYEIDGVKGLNNILINKQDLNGAGNVLYYQLDALEFTATKRMVLVD
ncbi:MAG TPA: cohesin domain-containing protein, partial [Saprospiraceae bacterium]|nr:cohesin domain-containing protein [Saprospiraceae bacterium]